MSTRSSIAVKHVDGTVSAVYCHFDGYLDGVGKTLIDEHNTFEAAEALVALGDLSTVVKHVSAYHRDKGESFKAVSPKKYADVETYLTNVPEEIGDNGYRYLFENDEWKVWGRGSGIGHTPIPVEAAITKAAALKEIG